MFDYTGDDSCRDLAGGCGGCTPDLPGEIEDFEYEEAATYQDELEQEAEFAASDEAFELLHPGCTRIIPSEEDYA